MNQLLKIALWNANGLAQHCQELQLFIAKHNLDIVLVSETHFTDLSFFRIPNFTLYTTNHPDDRAHAGSAVLIKKHIKHYELPKYQFDYIQSTFVVVEFSTGPLAIGAVYCPPRHNITHQQFNDFFTTLGCRFVSGGDYNAKHPTWGSRLANPRGRQLLHSLHEGNLDYLSTGEPTYWPSDRQKIPDLLDFFVTKGLPRNNFHIEQSLDLSSDHSPVILTLASSVILRPAPPSLYNRNTNWDYFRELIDRNINLRIPLKSPEDLDMAVEHLNNVIQNSAWRATPDSKTEIVPHMKYPVEVNMKIAEKRRLRRVWQNSRMQRDKNNLNRATQQLKRLLKHIKNERFQEFTSKLSPTEASDYSLWKATRYLKRPQICIPPILKNDGTWAKDCKDKAETFASYFKEVFKPHNLNSNIEQDILEFNDSPNQLDRPIKPFTPNDVSKVIKYDLNGKKAPGYDLITGTVLKELPRKGIVLLTVIFNAILRLEYFPSQWKVSQIVVIPKPGKPPHQVSSYRPISLLPVISKVFEKLFLQRLQILIDENEIVPSHQFGFRRRHSTVEQVHRISNVIKEDLENKRFCSAAFLDVSQAFDKVWHAGLLFKIKSLLPHTYFGVLKSYLSNRYFQIKFEDYSTELHEIESGVPQGSVLGPVLYILFTYDLPQTPGITVATFADDTALLSSDLDPVQASSNLQTALDDISQWLTNWKIKVNENKSLHVTFTMRTPTCPAVTLNNVALPQADEVKYLGIHLDRRLTWHSHIWNKRLQLNLKTRNLAWLLGNRSKLSSENKLLLYKIILKPVWTYGIQLWGTTSNSNIEIIQRYQSKTLRMILQAPWFVTNRVIHNDTGILTVREEITKYSKKYQTKLEEHPNHLAVNLLDNSQSTFRLQRHHILDLRSRFE